MSMLILKVDGRVHERIATNKDQAEFKVRFQEAEIIREGRRPRCVVVSLGKRDRYEEGLYTLSADSFIPDRFERLELTYPSLVPLGDALKAGEKECKAWKGRKLI